MRGAVVWCVSEREYVRVREKRNNTCVRVREEMDKRKGERERERVSE